MQAALKIDETIVARLYAEAKRRGAPASALVEAAILQILGATPVVEKPAEALLAELLKMPPVPRLVDISNRAELYGAMDEYDGFRC